MHRCGSGLFLTISVALLVTLTGCLGKSTSNQSNGGLVSVSLSPGGNQSIETGGVLFFSATGKDGNGNTVVAGSAQFIVQSGTPNTPAPLSVTTGGGACAGTWDQTFAICTPGTPGIALVSALINGVSSPVTTIYVHQHIASIRIQQAGVNPPDFDCFPSGQTWQFEAIPYNSSNVDISNTVGPMTWFSSNASVVSTTAKLSGDPGNQVNLVETTAKAPGTTQLSASISGTTSTPYPFTTCLIKAIYLQVNGQNEAGNTITVASGSSVSIHAIAIDTLYGQLVNGIPDNQPLSTPPLTWSTSDPEVASFSSVTTTTGTNSATTHGNLGSAALTASCTPPSCNVGISPSLPIYASNCNVDDLSTPCPLSGGTGGTKGFGTVTVSVTSTSKEAVSTAWAATTDCANAPGCTSALFSVTPSTTPIASIVNLPRTPNSLMFNHQSRLYIGSDQGLMFVDAGTGSPTVSPVFSSSTPCSQSLCGKVLAISNDGNRVVVADTVSTPTQVYIYNASGNGAAPIDLVIGETVTAAAFSPDELKLFILTKTGRMYVYSTVDALTFVTVANTASDVKFSRDGSFAYVAGTPAATSVSGYATCDTPPTQVVTGVPITTTNPTTPQLGLFPMPTQQVDSQGNWTESVLALDPPNLDLFGVSELPLPLLQFGQYTCIPPSVTLDTHYPKTSINVGEGNFVPLYAELAGHGDKFVLVAQKIPAVLLFNVSNGSISPLPSIPLANGADPISASAAPDGSEVFVAACDQYDQSVNPPVCSVGSIHIVDTISQGDIQQVPYINAGNNNDRNMCNNGGNPVQQCLPNLVAVKPQ